jgi:hypothetical protein
MKNLQDFLLFCSGADRQMLKRCPSETNKYVGIGGTVLFTATLAFFAAAYALFTVFDSVWAAIAFGMVWGLMIFNLDRYIVSSMKNRGKIWRDLVVALPRLGLAVIIAVIISKPLELKLFDKEIQAELILIEQELITEQEALISERFDTAIALNQAELTLLADQVMAQTMRRNNLAQIALEEADGTGGSQIRNMGPIYKAKKAEADKAQSELVALQTELQPRITAINNDITRLENEKIAAIAGIERVPYDGMAARIDALSRLGEKSTPIQTAHIFIMLLFIIIESSPVLIKLINYRSPYDYVLHKHEHQFEMFHLEKTSLLSNATHNKVRYDTEVGSYELGSRIKEERAKIDARLKQKIDDLKLRTSS